MYILSAVRTPIGLLNGSLYEFSVGQLSAFVLREALERAVVPAEEIEQLFMGCALESNFDKEVIKRTGLPKCTKILTSKCSLESFIKGCCFIHQHNKKVCLVSGVESMSNNLLFKEYNSLEAVLKGQSKNSLKKILDYKCPQGSPFKINDRNYENYNTIYKSDASFDELAKILFKKKGQQIVVTKDEEIKGNDVCQKAKTNSRTLLSPGDGAAAALIASEEYVKKNQLTPLGEVISFANESVNGSDYALIMCQTIRKALDIAGFDSRNISVWELNALNEGIVLSCSDQLNINHALINKSGVFSTGHPIGMYGGKMIAHVIHSLSHGELGCAAGFSIEGTISAVVLRKLCIKTSTKPQLTLYTKKACPMCDNLVEQLEPYKGLFSLQKIDIELDGNEKLKNLYQYEIPVLFLDGIFLCKHKLDPKHLIQRLCKSEKFQSCQD